jgi:hypothetical protein
MKKLLLAIICLSLSAISIAQKRAPIVNSAKDQPVKLQYTAPVDGSEFYAETGTPVKSSSFFAEEEIGETIYDKQSNRSTSQRTYLFEDGTMAATWTFSMESSGFSDRGSAYNYYDGNSWGPWPTSRIETQKGGWPSYAPLGENGEIIVSHNAVDALLINRRAEKGTGAWVETILQGPPGNLKVTWPRVITTGPDHNIVHVLGMIRDLPETGDMTLAYYRSEDGGDVWDIANMELEGTGHDYYTDLGADSYIFAEPRADMLAFLVVNIWCDAFMMKSDDGGDSWEKTIIWEHPYPFWDWETTITTDTLWAPDHTGAIALDSEGKAHVLLSVCRVAHTEPGTTYSYWAISDGIAYWNEDRPEFEADNPHDALDPIDVLIEDYNLVGWSQDVDNNGVVEFEKDVFAYGMKGISTMPAMVIDEMNRIFFAYASTTETYFGETYNFKHIWMRASNDGGETWEDFLDITSDLIHIFDECIYPVMTPMSDNQVYVMYNADGTPGLMIDEDHSAEQNRQVFVNILKDELVGSGELNKEKPGIRVSPIFPNPFHTTTTVRVDLPEASLLTLEVYNLVGDAIATIPCGKKQAGSHQITVDATGWTPGVYMYTVVAGDQTYTGKMIVN